MSLQQQQRIPDLVIVQADAYTKARWGVRLIFVWQIITEQGEAGRLEFLLLVVLRQILLTPTHLGLQFVLKHD